MQTFQPYTTFWAYFVLLVNRASAIYITQTTLCRTMEIEIGSNTIQRGVALLASTLQAHLSIYIYIYYNVVYVQAVKRFIRFCSLKRVKQEMEP